MGVIFGVIVGAAAGGYAVDRHWRRSGGSPLVRIETLLRWLKRARK